MKAVVVLLSATGLFLSACASVPQGPFPKGSLSDAQSRTRQAYRCAAEAADLVRLMPEYRHSGAKRRSQMRNSSIPVVGDMQSLCWRMAKATDADAGDLNNDCEDQLVAIRQRFGDRALGDVGRLADSCQQLTGHSLGL